MIVPDLVLTDAGSKMIDISKDVVMEKPIGEGGFSTVYKGVYAGKPVFILFFNFNTSLGGRKSIKNEFRSDSL